MPQHEYLEFNKTYSYEEEIPYDGATEDGLEDAEVVSGDITWGADITWNDSIGKYTVLTIWTDHANNFSDNGEGPMSDQFTDDLLSFLEAHGINYGDLEY